MRKRICLTFVIGCILPLTITAAQYDVPETMITLHVTDENGNPITNANAGAALDMVDATGGTFIKPEHGFTDSNGMITVSGKTQSTFYYGAKLDGYYETTGLRFYAKGHENGRWLPWNPTLEVVLKKIVKPIPMYARVVNTSIPVKDKQIGFDLMVYDWLPPYGKGSVADFLFLLDSKTQPHTLHISFSNKGDGIQLVDAPPQQQGSRLRSPRIAPENGYQSEWTKTDSNPDRVYIFRVRTVMNNKGEITEAMYGKIYGDFFYFTYYLNPDKTRNLEYDKSKNLATDLQWFEAIQEN